MARRSPTSSGRYMWRTRRPIPSYWPRTRVRQLTIDPGPRTISGRDTAAVRFDVTTRATYCDPSSRDVVPLPDYPKSFPDDSFSQMASPAGPISTLGHLETDQLGRLIVVGGYGRASGWKVEGQAPMTDDVNNDHWFDDTSDGPVTAAIVFDDGSRVPGRGRRRVGDDDRPFLRPSSPQCRLVVG